MLPRPDLLSPNSPPGLEVFQLTTEPDVPASHIYMEAQIFAPDSRRFVLHRSAHPHGSDPKDPEHQYLLCDLEANGSLTPLTTELGTTGPSISPDGRYLYYFVDETHPWGGRLTLKRVQLDGTGRETLCVIDGALPGESCAPSRPYPLSTISSDGQRVAISAFLGDHRVEYPMRPDWGLLVFDVAAGSVALVLRGGSWCNVHPQYSRSLDPEESHDILVQENHGNITGPEGKVTKLVGGAGADLHVIRDDGSRPRTLPFGRDGNEFCQGHQCWRGRSDRVITSTMTRKPASARLIEGTAVDGLVHAGLSLGGGNRTDLTASYPHPDFYHFATDETARRFITDSGPRDGGGGLHVAEFSETPGEELQNWRFLLCPRSSWRKDAHIHPFLSPDGRTGFFNSDESGVLQAYLVRGF
ncbi:MAG: hypothetical protein FJX77_04360 [Armatimonadetes bacterium]|nr:hypothetical protein [Armatimonadota bacterium]